MTCRLIACWQKASKFIPHFVAPHVSISGIILSKKRSDNHKFPISFTIIRFSNKAHLEPAAWNYYFFSLIIISFNSCFFCFISKLHNQFTTSPVSLLIWNQKSKTSQTIKSKSSVFLKFTFFGFLHLALNAVDGILSKEMLVFGML